MAEDFHRSVETGFDDGAITVSGWSTQSLYGGVVEITGGRVATEDDFNRVRSELVGAYDAAGAAMGWEVRPDVAVEDFGAMRRRLLGALDAAAGEIGWES